jgi:iron complex transport system substrate-binding protein
VKKGKREKVFFAVILAAILTGCRVTTDVNGPSPSPSEDTHNEGRPAMRVMTDGLGRRVTLPIKVTRAVSLAPNLTESIFAVGAGDRLVGVTTFCDYPEQAKSIAKVGDTMNPNIERIVALKPDVVFVSTASQIEAFTNILANNDIAVYVTDPKTLTGLYSDLQQMGIIFNTEKTASRFVSDLQRREDNVRTRCDTWPMEDRVESSVKPVRVFTQISKEPLFTIGESSFLTDVIKAAGGEPVPAGIKTAYPKLSKETALALDPEAVILSDSEDNREPNEVFRNSPAVKNGRVYRINADLLSRPGPRLVDALEQIAKDLHPEKFAEE